MAHGRGSFGRRGGSVPRNRRQDICPQQHGQRDGNNHRPPVERDSHPRGSDAFERFGIEGFRRGRGSSVGHLWEPIALALCSSFAARGAEKIVAPASLRDYAGKQPLSRIRRNVRVGRQAPLMLRRPSQGRGFTDWGFGSILGGSGGVVGGIACLRGSV